LSGYTKLFNSILASTIWRSDDKTRIVWITLLAMADRHGVAEGSVPGLADFARVSVEDCRRALNVLQAPDEDSRSDDHEGRRILKIDGGWLILNHAKYRAKASEDERRDYLRRKQAESRAKRVNNVNKRQQLSKPSTQAEAEAEEDPDPDLDLGKNEDPDKVKIGTHAGGRSSPPPVENNSGWVPPHPNPHHAPTNLINGAEMRRHAQHAWCAEGRPNLCVSHAMHTEIMGAAQKPEAEVKAWYVSVIAKFNGQPIGDDRFVFWRNELAAWLGTVTSPPPKNAPSQKVTEAMRKLREWRKSGAKS
jgi:hypothetical protein